MRIEEKLVTIITLAEIEGLDPVSILFEDYGGGSGTITIWCWGDVWTAHWGAMGMSLREFIHYSNTDYLVNKLATDRTVYVTRIVEAIKDYLK